MSVAPDLTPQEEALIELGSERIGDLWRAGDISWKLDAHQYEIYAAYRAWEKQPAVGDGADRIFVLDAGRQSGKTWLVSAIKVEDCLRQTRSLHIYACAFYKDIAEIVMPAIEEFCEDAPEDVRPRFAQSHGGRTMGYLFPHNGSFLKLVGLDVNPKGLRGRPSDGIAISEAGHIKGLASTIAGTLYPQFTRRPKARMILESNAPEDEDHDFDTIFVPDAEKRSQQGLPCYFKRTLDDNLAMTESEKREIYNGVAAIEGKETADREFYGLRVRSTSRFIVPEFDEGQHLVEGVERPAYAHCYVSMDPAERDPLGLIWAFWDFERAKLVIQRSFAKPAVRTGELADLIRSTEVELWGTPRHEGPRPMNDAGYRRGEKTQAWKFTPPGEHILTYWDVATQSFRPNPYRRVSDVDLHLVGDLSVDFGLPFNVTAKTDMISQLNRLRNAFAMNQIEICEDDPGPLRHQLKHCKWNENRTDWERTPLYGHADCIAALMYMWRNLDRHVNPFPPAITDLRQPNLAVMPWHALESQAQRTARTLKTVLHGRRPKRRGMRAFP